jgi:hypothetical protein
MEKPAQESIQHRSYVTIIRQINNQSINQSINQSKVARPISLTEESSDAGGLGVLNDRPVPIQLLSWPFFACFRCSAKRDGEGNYFLRKGARTPPCKA